MSATKRISLALQGGGSHGAYTWSALDAILEDERLEIDGVSGTSAGAMNAVVMASGLLKDRTTAREKLERFGAPSPRRPHQARRFPASERGFL
jgi:NTE family protein